MDFTRVNKKHDTEMSDSMRQGAGLQTPSQSILVSASVKLKEKVKIVCCCCKRSVESPDTQQVKRGHKRLDSNTNLLHPQESMISMSGFNQDIRAHHAWEAVKEIIDEENLRRHGEPHTVIIHADDADDVHEAE